MTFLSQADEEVHGSHLAFGKAMPKAAELAVTCRAHFAYVPTGVHQKALSPEPQNAAPTFLYGQHSGHQHLQHKGTLASGESASRLLDVSRTLDQAPSALLPQTPQPARKLSTGHSHSKSIHYADRQDRQSGQAADHTTEMAPGIFMTGRQCPIAVSRQAKQKAASLLAEDIGDDMPVSTSMFHQRKRHCPHRAPMGPPLPQSSAHFTGFCRGNQDQITISAESLHKAQALLASPTIEQDDRKPGIALPTELLPGKLSAHGKSQAALVAGDMQQRSDALAGAGAPGAQQVVAELEVAPAKQLQDDLCRQGELI